MRRVFLGLLLAFSISVSAHESHGAELLSVALHPFTGWDHLLAMLLVGVLMAKYPRKEGWLIPVAFVTAFSVGLFSGSIISGAQIPLNVNYFVWGSLIIFSVALLMKKLPSIFAMSALAAFFGMSHGVVHGEELVLANSGYYLGLIGATALLHLIGFATSTFLEQKFNLALKAFIVVTGLAGLVAIVAA